MNFLRPITPATTGPELMPMRKASRRPPKAPRFDGRPHVERETREGACMIGTFGRYTRSDHVAVADGLDLLDAVLVDQAVETMEDLVEQLDELERRHRRGHRREVDDVGEQDAG